MTVRYNGDANLCCFDPFSKVSFGNVNTQTLEEIWLSPARQDYVKKHQIGQGNKLALCEACTEG
jgi:radical SAM protein with 4Fe4S-binding SPASM domain